MSIPRYAKRDIAEPEIIKALRLCGVTVYKIDLPVDLILGFRGRTYLCEVKSPDTAYGKGLNKNQQLFQNSWQGGEIVLLRTPEDAAEWANHVTTS